MADVDSGPAPDGAPPLGPPHPVTLVLVEDHEVVRRELRAMLELAGLRVVAAVGTAEDGRRAVQALQPHVAVVDTALPDGSGIELCRDLRTVAPGTATIVHTATVVPGLERMAHEAGASDVVLKAIDCRALLRAIERRATAE